MSHSDTGSAARPLARTRRSVLRATAGVAGGGLFVSASAMAQDTSDGGTDPGGGIGFGFEPAETGGTASERSYDLVVTGVDDGIGAYELSIESSDPTSVRITDVSLVAFGGQFSSVDIAADGSTAFIEEATGDASVSSEAVIIARVTVTAADTAGTTELRVGEDARIRSTAGSFYDIGTTGTLTAEVNSTAEREPEPVEENGTDRNSSDAGQTADGTPGFGIGSSVAAIGSVGYLLTRYMGIQQDE